MADGMAKRMAWDNTIKVICSHKMLRKTVKTFAHVKIAHIMCCAKCVVSFACIFNHRNDNCLELRV